MSDDRGFERAMHAWLESGSDRTPATAIDAVLLAVRTTPQERGLRAPWRTPAMNSPMRLAAVLAAVAVLGVAGLMYLNRGPAAGDAPAASAPAAVASSPTASIAPSPSRPASVTGLIAFSKVTNAVARILSARPDGSGVATLITNGGNNVQPAWSPDNKSIAWATSDGIRIARADGSDVVQLTNDGRDRHPAWSPDSSMIVFASGRDGDVDIYSQSVAGGDPVRLTDNAVDDDHPSWSAVTNLIAFASTRSGSSDIWTMSPDGRNPTRLTSDGGMEVDPSWSPDGTKIAFASDRDDGTSSIYLMNADASGVVRLSRETEAEHSPAWSPDGRFVAFTASRTNLAIVIVDVNTHEVVSTISTARTEISDAAWRNP
jgi:Tol biopolymer transport system component